MKIFKILCCVALLVGLVTFAHSAEQTWSGKISDSMCGASHAGMISQHPGLTDRACTLACVKGGGKYVFVSDDGKVYAITNQDSPLLAMHAGHTVRLTGDMKGEMITVSNIVMPGKQ
jgi:hypothetical protein